MEAKLRHQQFILSYSGGAVILFGVWGIVKIITNLILYPVDWSDVVGSEQVLEFSPIVYNITLCIMFAVFSLAVILIRLYVGLSAIKEGKGLTAGYFYLFVTALLFIANTLSSIIILYRMFKGEYVNDSGTYIKQTIPSVIIELSSQMAFLMVFVASCRARQLKKRIRMSKSIEQVSP